MAVPPSNFSWVTENIAGSGYPWEKSNLEFLVDKTEISVIINLSGKHYEEIPGLKIIEIPIPDFGLPSKNQVLTIMRTIENHSNQGNKLLIHCIAGCGRTGMILALWIAYTSPDKERGKILQELRQLRSCSFDTEEQVQFFNTFRF